MGETEAQERSRNLFKVMWLVSDRVEPKKPGGLAPRFTYLLVYHVAFPWGEALKFHLRSPAVCWGGVCVPHVSTSSIRYSCPFFLHPSLLQGLTEAPEHHQGLPAALRPLSVSQHTGFHSKPTSFLPILSCLTWRWYIPPNGLSFPQTFL